MYKIFLLILLITYANSSLIEFKNKKEINILPSSEILVPTKKLYFNEVKSNKNWKDIKEKNISFKQSIIPKWIKFDIKNSTKDKLFLEYEFALVETLNIYITRNNRLIKKFETGIDKKFNSRPIDSNKFIFPIDIKQEKTYTIYLEVSNRIQSNLISLRLYNKETYKDKELQSYLLTTILISFLSLMFMYNLIIYIFIKYEPYKYYLIYITSIILLNLVQLGYAYKFFYPDQILLNKILTQFSEAFFMYSFTFFIISILEIKKKTVIYKILISLIILIFITIGVNFFLYYIESLIIPISEIKNYIFFLLITILTIIMIYKTKNGNQIAMFLLFSWFFPLVIMFLYPINKIYYFIDINIIHTLGQLSFIIELMFMSLILGLIISQTNKEKNDLIIKNKNTEILLLQELKFSAMGKMLSYIAHQWKQPLMRINAIILNMDTNYNIKLSRNKKFQNYLCSIEKETEYMSEIVRIFSRYFHDNKVKENINLYNTFNEVISLYKEQFIKNNISIKILCNNLDTDFYGNKEELKQVLLILIDNIIDSFEKTKDKEKRIICEVDKIQEESFISIENSGENILDENIDCIFEPYFTTKKKNNEGLGLYIAKMIIEDSMQKKINVYNTNLGVKFIIKG